MVTLKINAITNQNYYSQTLIVLCKKLKQKVSKKTLAEIKRCWISIIIQLKQNAMIIQKQIIHYINEI